MKKQHLLLVIAAFVATRGINVFLATNPQVYGTTGSQVAWEPIKYGSWAFQIIDGHRTPYSGIDIEYPPGVLPFAVLPEIGRDADDTYLVRFVFTMLAVDVAAFVGILLLARRWGSIVGPWLWVVGLFVLGPISYTRLDLIPALATVGAIERAAAGSWFGSGGWLAFGALSKVYPVFLMPVAFFVSTRRGKLVSGIALVSFLSLLPYLGALPQLYDSVFGFHSGRGIHVESIWGAGLLAAAGFGYPATVEVSFGAFHVASGLTSFLKGTANLLALAAVAAGAWRARRHRGSVPEMAALMFGTLAIVMAVGTVFSPQFIVWLVALGAVTLCYPSRPLRGPLLSLVPIALVTHIIYPFIYELLLDGNRSAVAVVASRDLLVLVAGLGTWAALDRRRATDDATEPIEGPLTPSGALSTSAS